MARTGTSFETTELRRELDRFLKSDFQGRPVGRYAFGVYAFYDYDGEPIYVGQTKEQVSTRIRRHLTNQRTDAVAMSVLDPFEVGEIEVWPLVDFQGVTKKENKERFSEAKEILNGLEHRIFQRLIADSAFRAILNEKEPPPANLTIPVPDSFRAPVVSERVKEVRDHPDVRIARRALTISRLAQVISERQVNPGLRHTLVAQARRLEALAERRLSDFEKHAFSLSDF